MPLPINIEDLLSARTVESDRIEFKAGRNPDGIYRSICAFANDFDNTGGGYILIGMEEMNGIAKRPVKGLSGAELAEIQKKMIGLNNLIDPVYHSRLYIEEADGKQIFVLWVTGGTSRPYKVPEHITAKNKRPPVQVQDYLRISGSRLVEWIGQRPLTEILEQMALLEGPSEHLSLRNVALMLFSEHPDRFFPYTYIDLVHFPKGPADQQFIEKQLHLSP